MEAQIGDTWNIFDEEIIITHVDNNYVGVEYICLSTFDLKNVTYVKSYWESSVNDEIITPSSKTIRRNKIKRLL